MTSRSAPPERRPLVLLSCRRTSKNPEVATAALVHSADDAYVRCVLAAGGLPALLPLIEVASILDRYLEEHADGLLLTGGDDPHPELFGEEVHPRCRDIQPDRDRFEIHLVRQAFRAGLPILAICRGLQIANIALGGSIHQDLAAQVPEAFCHEPRLDVASTSHTIGLTPETRLFRLAGTHQVAVNSSHHQAVRDAARPLRVTARSTDGVVEAMEAAPDGPYFMGVQFHPERRPADPLTAAIFGDFVAACRDHRATRAPIEAARETGRTPGT